MVTQTNYEDVKNVGFPGQIANSERANITTLIAEAELAFGAVGTVGATARGVRGMAASRVPVGIMARSNMERASNTADTYAVNDPSGIVDAGVVFVTLGGTVATGDDVTFSDAGVIGAASSTNKFPQGAKYLDGGGPGDVVRIRLN